MAVEAGSSSPSTQAGPRHSEGISLTSSETSLEAHPSWVMPACITFASLGFFFLCLWTRKLFRKEGPSSPVSLSLPPTRGCKCYLSGRTLTIRADSNLYFCIWQRQSTVSQLWYLWYARVLLTCCTDQSIHGLPVRYKEFLSLGIPYGYKVLFLESGRIWFGACIQNL